jgi:hypothetical protein
MGSLRITLAVVFAVVITAITSCSHQPVTYLYLRVYVDGQSTLGITKWRQPRGLVIFFHGLDTDEYVLTGDEVHKRLTDQLLDAGFAVVASKAGGNAYGNEASQHNYRQLGRVAVKHYQVTDVYLLAESMGTVAAVNLLAFSETLRIHGLAAILPVLDLNSAPPGHQADIPERHPDEPLESVNPMKLPLGSLRGKTMRFYVNHDDSLATTEEQAAAFQTRFGSAAKISIVPCKGGELDPSCMQGTDIVRWFASL